MLNKALYCQGVCYFKILTLYEAVTAAVNKSKQEFCHWVMNFIHCSLCLCHTASHSTSQLSQKLKTTYKASTSKVPGTSHVSPFNRARKTCHVCKYLSFWDSGLCEVTDCGKPL